MKNNTLKSLLKEIAATQKVAESDPAECDYRVRSGYAVSINQAKEHLAVLKDAYKKQLLANSKVYFVNGPREQVRKFARHASELPTTSAIPANAMYKQLAIAIEPQFGTTREFLVGQYSRVMADLKEMTGKLGVMSITGLDLRNFPILPDIDTTTLFLRHLIRESNGDTINSLFISEEIAKHALEIGYRESVIHVVILNAEFEEARNLSKSFAQLGCIIEIADEDDVTADFVKSVFETKQLTKKEKTEKPDKTEKTTANPMQSDNKATKGE